MDCVRLLSAVLEDSPHNRHSMAAISGALYLSIWIIQRVNVYSSGPCIRVPSFVLMSS